MMTKELSPEQLAALTVACEKKEGRTLGQIAHDHNVYREDYPETETPMEQYKIDCLITRMFIEAMVL